MRYSKRHYGFVMGRLAPSRAMTEPISVFWQYVDLQTLRSGAAILDHSIPRPVQRLLILLKRLMFLKMFLLM